MITWLALLTGILLGICWERHRPARVVVSEVDVENGTISVSDASKFQVGQAIEWVWK